MCTRHNQRGVSLVELIMFIVIVGAALAGILTVMNTVTRGSADPLVRKQALAIAESLLEEIESQDFANPAGGFAGAATQANRAQFDDVMDYNGYVTAGAFSIDGAAPAAGLGNYGVAVGVVPQGVWNGIAAGNSVLITVTVAAPNGELVTATGIRTAY
ncbi:MAG TPA: type II secretion system protein [Gallionella sp.]|nr:type II secretion system protein [Gallionella sp.]